MAKNSNAWLMNWMSNMMNQSSYLDREYLNLQRDFQNQLLATANRRYEQSEKYIREKDQQYLSIGENYRGQLVDDLSKKVQRGELSSADAASRMQSFYGQYPGMEMSDADFQTFRDVEAEYAPQIRDNQISRTWRNLLGRNPTTGELQTLETDYALRGGELGLGQYSLDSWESEGRGDLENYIKTLTEYKKDKPTAQQQENIAKYGEGIKDEDGIYTNQYRLNLGTSFLPSQEDAEKLEGLTGIKAPEFFKTGIIQGSSDAIEMAKGRLNAYDSFLYSSGLAQLEGNIRKEQNKLNNEAQMKLSKMNNEFGLMNTMISAFQ